MSVFLEPRVVERPYRNRWLRAALRLFVRSPVRFGACIAALAWLDTALTGSTQSLLQWLSLLMLPLVWAVVSALARGADDRAQTLSAFAGFLRIRLWLYILTTGALLVAAVWAPVHLGHSLWTPVSSATRGSRSGELLGAIAAQSAWVYTFFGTCFLPLLVLVPEMSLLEARRLSLRAKEINDQNHFFGLWLRLLLVLFILWNLPPAYGLTTAAWMVFTGILNYVAYRDIFERRAGNLPLQEATAASPTANTVLTGISG